MSFFGNHEIILIKEYEKLEGEYDEKVFFWNLSGLLFTLLVGTLLHFVYDWFGGSFWAVLGAVNESTWEHLKLVFWPIVLFGFIEYLFYGKKYQGILTYKGFFLADRHGFHCRGLLYLYGNHWRPFFGT